VLTSSTIDGSRADSAVFASTALLPGGWASDVRVTIAKGRVVSADVGAMPKAGDQRAAVLLPAMPNLHSHAFQRAMAGLAETRGPGEDSFWSWRDTMYRFALAMTPEQVEAVAAQLYMEMLEAGFGRVGEFHYLHHDRDGSPYANVAEMAERIVAAAAQTGIRLTLLPVFYAHAGFGRQSPQPRQRRFINDVDSFGNILEASRQATSRLPGAIVGVAPHSLRAVTPEELGVVTQLANDGPIHIHVAEQVKEVEDCIAWSGARPVEWLLAHAPVDGRWCLIHATHMTSSETAATARSGAVAGLCPITESNLGDGIFPGRAFLDAGGRYGIGSDSNVLIGLADELRTLEYSQRLGSRGRTVLAAPGQSNGRALFEAALAGGSAALDAGTGGIAEGASADLVTLAETHTPFDGRDGDAVLDAWLFAGGARVDGMWIGGRQVVVDGRHVRRDQISTRFRSAMRALTA
jgi:formiminoglutamate deiminase